MNLPPTHNKRVDPTIFSLRQKTLTVYRSCGGAQTYEKNTTNPSHLSFITTVINVRPFKKNVQTPLRAFHGFPFEFLEEAKNKDLNQDLGRSTIHFKLPLVWLVM